MTTDLTARVRDRVSDYVSAPTPLGGRLMMITHQSKRVIPFRAHDAKRVGEGCFYLDQIVWLNGDRIEMGDRVSFNVGCFVNGYGGLEFHEGANMGPYCMLHTANHNFDDLTRPVVDQGWQDDGPMVIGRNAWIGMGSIILPGVKIGEGCVVGAGSVVTRDLEEFTIAVGNPAKAIRSRR